MSTHTYAVLDISADAFTEIERKLRAADYHHCFIQQEGRHVIDMSGIAVAAGAAKTLMPPGHWVMQEGDHDWDGKGYIIGDSDFRRNVRNILREGIRAATGSGTCLDFDPDALVIDILNRLCGPCANIEQLERVR